MTDGPQSSGPREAAGPAAARSPAPLVDSTKNTRRCPGSAADMTRIVPQTNHGLGQVVLVSERAQACRAQEKETSGSRLEAEPAGGEHPEKMSARKQQHVARSPAHPAHHLVGPRAHLRRRL